MFGNPSFLESQIAAALLVCVPEKKRVEQDLSGPTANLKCNQVLLSQAT